MAFLQQSELKTVADPNIVVIITGMDETITDSIIAESIDVMKGYLSRYYDIGNIFNKTGDDRNLTIVKHLKAIVIYEVYMRHTREINTAAQKRYDEAMNLLEKLNTGDFFLKNLPPISSQLPSPNGEQDQQVRFSSDIKYLNSY